MTQAASPRLNQALEAPILSVMNFLNEVKVNFPNAISFSAGRPAESFFHVTQRLKHMDLFLDHFSKKSGLKGEALWGNFGQYGKTDGLICDLLATHLRIDENLSVEEKDIVVTTGCQEAMALVLMGLFSQPNDCLLTADPTYIGITGLAKVMGIDTVPIPCGDEGIELDALEAELTELKRNGKSPKAIYVIPDFNNPLGSDMPLSRRERLLDIARNHGVFILEDNPYGAFVYDGEALPTLKALDREERVIYFGTFSKTLFPSLRLGYLVTGASVPDSQGVAQPLAEGLTKIKSLTTVNTCALSQAVVGGELLRTGGALKATMNEHIDHYRSRRDAMLTALDQAFPPGNPWREKVTWNRPRGGFFLTVTLPFSFGEQALAECAEKFGVIVVPMRYFSLGGGRDHQIRLSFCSNTLEEIHVGIPKLAEFIQSYDASAVG